jgi:beta-lactam-binding protein with PASTA domain
MSSVKLPFPQRSWFQSRKRLVVGAAAAAALVAAAVTGVTFVAQVEVPSVEGMNVEAAAETLEASGLVLDVHSVDWAGSLSKEWQVVRSQSPAGAVRAWRGTTVQLEMGPAQVQVPDLVGMSHQEARAELEKIGLRATAEFETESALEWDVTKQSAASGTSAEAGTEVELQLGVPDVEVPELVGLTRGAASQEVAAAGLKLSISPTTAGMDWIVESASSDGGSNLRYGSDLEIVLVRPPVLVPDVIGMTIDEAERELEEAEFIVEYPSDVDTSWKVTAQKPAPGKLAAHGSSVSVRAKQPQIVFSVTGNGSRALVTWVVPGSFSIAQDGNAQLPWSISFPYHSFYDSYELGNVSAQLLNGSSITCTITVDGRVTKTVTSTGAYSIAMCG